MLSDREAADMQAGTVVAEISNRVHAAVHAAPFMRPTDSRLALFRDESAIALRRKLMSGSNELLKRLSEIYSKLDGAPESPLVEELIKVVSDRVCAFVMSTANSVRGAKAAAAAHLAAEICNNIRMGAASTFKLAAYDAHKDRPKPTPPPAPLPKVDEDARAAFDRLPIHADVRAACEKQFVDGHYREAVLNAGIALVDYVKQRAGNPTDAQGKALDNTPLMQRVFGGTPPILKVNDLQTDSDKSEQQGMMFLFSGVALGLRNPRAHSLDSDTAEYAVEAIALISFLYKVAESAKP